MTFSVRQLLAVIMLPLAVALPVSVSAGTKVAMIADTGAGENFREVLNLIRDEGAEIMLVQGDLGYDPNTANRWKDQINAVLGRDFPMLAVVGNHENFEWPLYQRSLERRIDRINGLSCKGEVGVKADCKFANLQVVQVAPGVNEVNGVSPNDNYAQFIRSSFENSSDYWRICTWHKNQNAMQAYTKPNSTGWAVYDACLDVGALVVNGHAHTYSRTYLMKDFRTQEVAHRNSNMTIRPGRSLVVVSGLGGRDVREQGNDGDWFAHIYTGTQGASHGALFCTFEQLTAECYFKSVTGAVPDRFTLQRAAGSSAGVDEPSSDTSRTGVFQRTDRNEFRWIDMHRSGQWASRKISANCAKELGGARYSGDWSDLIALAPLIDTSAEPCDQSGTAAPPPPRQGNAPAATPNPAGYVFSRTDTTEYRWIDENSDGQYGSIAIAENCVAKMGGVRATGDWSELMARAPGFDTLENPCTALAIPDAVLQAGYVFSRTDKNEYRWISPNDSGELGNIWIDKNCADRLGGVKSQGDWFDLLEESPGFDTVSNPCY